MCTTAQRHGVKNVFNVGPRLMLIDGTDGINEYIDGKQLYIMAHDGRVLKNPNGTNAISLVEPNLQANHLTGGPGGPGSNFGLTVWSPLIVFANF